MGVTMSKAWYLAGLAVVAMACNSTGAAQPLGLALVGTDALAREAAALVAADVARSDTDGRMVSNAADTLVIELATVAADTVTSEGFRLTSMPSGGVRVEASDLLGLQYGAWEVLERAGLVYIHPLKPVFPAAWCHECLADIHVNAVPGYRMRGTHIHTMHPIEYESTLLGHDPATLERFDALLGWLVARRQNYLEWNLLRTVDWDRWIAHAQKLADRAHARGIRIGIVAPLAFRQQNSFYLVDLADSDTPATDQIRAHVDRLMAVDWDMVGSEMGASEFFSVSDTEQVAQMSFLAAYLDEVYGVGAATKVHCTINQTAPSYGNINFNYIAKFTDPRMGVMPHTVQWYDLYRNAPTYDRQNMHDMREFLLGEIGKRPVYYYPETAYWVTFDNDVPLFLPQYVYARWLDLYNLRNSGMDGQINFSSGFEWGYWLNDMAAAWYAYSPAETWTTVLDRALSPLGAARTDAVALLAEYITKQGDELLQANGIRWLIAWDAADDIGHFANIHGQPIVTRLYEVAQMEADELSEFEAGEYQQLLGLEAWLTDYAERWEALAPQVAAAGVAIHDEFAIGMRITALRAGYMQRLYAAVLARRKAELGLAGADTAAYDLLLAEADAIFQEALTVVARQEANYRFPFDEIAADRFSYTSYPFGYLRTVPDLWYWDRERKMVDDPKGFNFLESLYDLVASGGF